MKTKLVLATILSAITSLSAFANSEPVREVSCRDAREGIADSGYGVEILTGEVEEGQTIAHVYEQTIAGPRELGTFPVTSTESGLTRTYKGKHFTLAIDLESFAPTTEHPGRLVTKTASCSKLKANLICTLNQE